jgi:hypothetical protein
MKRALLLSVLLISPFSTSSLCAKENVYQSLEKSLSFPANHRVVLIVYNEKNQEVQQFKLPKNVTIEDMEQNKIIQIIMNEPIELMPQKREEKIEEQITSFESQLNQKNFKELSFLDLPKDLKALILQYVPLKYRTVSKEFNTLITNNCTRFYNPVPLRINLNQDLESKRPLPFARDHKTAKSLLILHNGSSKKDKNQTQLKIGQLLQKFPAVESLVLDNLQMGRAILEYFYHNRATFLPKLKSLDIFQMDADIMPGITNTSTTMGLLKNAIQDGKLNHLETLTLRKVYCSPKELASFLNSLTLPKLKQLNIKDLICTQARQDDVLIVRQTVKDQIKKIIPEEKILI